MGKKIITHDESEEDFILGSLMKGKRPELEDRNIEDTPITQTEENTDIEPTKEENRKRKNKNSDFKSTFLKDNNTSSRGGKNINIRLEFHNKIKKIITLIADNDLSYFGYIDNILEHHFNIYENEVNELLKKNNQL